MQFINIVVHSVEDMNFRVHLQYDFTKLNLEEHLEVIHQQVWSCVQPLAIHMIFGALLCCFHGIIYWNHRDQNNQVTVTFSSTVPPQRLKHTESDRLQVQIQAYLDNVFDVGTLLEDAETKTAALERVEELEENLTTVKM